MASWHGVGVSGRVSYGAVRVKKIEVMCGANMFGVYVPSMIPVNHGLQETNRFD